MRHFGWLMLWRAILFTQVYAAAPPVPAATQGWQLELIAAAPEVQHPSVVCSAPDGRVFVAEDPMDIRAPANAAQGRILCFHPDGRRTVFAEGLYAVFGMQYIEGKLYVLHNPKFSLFDANGDTASNRQDLIDSTNPNPWALEWNDHVPANFRLGMDGYLYAAVGDKGIYGAVGRDGQRVDLHGGGILRLRPDGTELEVFCTGARNILDVALTAEDEIFTYDNTDEQQWMGRVTHMVDGGFYGYPHDFIPRRPYTLWMMTDLGGGAATGTLAYTEDALPEAYQDNLFLADFGKRQIIRIQTQREGATFKPVSTQELFIDPPEDFRPVGIALSTDGRSIYICDWNHRDVKANVSVGRLWKLTWIGPSAPMAKPAWYVPLASGRKVEVTVPDLVQGLSHPAKTVRLTAQRELARRKSITALRAVLSDATQLPCARWHALWALHACDNRSAEVVLPALADPDPSIRRQAIRQLGARRTKEAVPALLSALLDPDRSVRFHAATALGRIAEPSAIDPLVRTLAEPDLFARYAAFTALNRIGRQTGQWNQIAQGLKSASPQIREGTEFALRETYDLALMRVLIELSKAPHHPEPTREIATRLIAALHHRTPPWRGEWWAYHPVNAPPPEKSIDWEGTHIVLAHLQHLLNDPSAQVRRASLMGIRRAKHSAAAERLRAQFSIETEPELRALIVSTLGRLKDLHSARLISDLLLNRQTPPELLGAAIEAGAQLGGPPVESALLELLSSDPLDLPRLVQVIDAAGQLRLGRSSVALGTYCSHASDPVRKAAFRALFRIDPSSALAHCAKLMSNAPLEVQRDAILALGTCKSPEAIPILKKACERDSVRADALIALAQIPNLDALDFYLDALQHSNAPVRIAAESALRAVRKEAKPLLQARLARLPVPAAAVLKTIYADDPNVLEMFASISPAAGPDDLLEYALKQRGDLELGRKLFQDADRLACTQCHTVRNSGRRIGPDLTTVGEQFSRRELAESVLFPNRAIREGYQTTTIETRDGESVSGLLTSEDAEEVHLLDSSGQSHRIEKSTIAKRQLGRLSLMPEGLAQTLSFNEFASLITYLESLRSSQAAPR